MNFSSLSRVSGSEYAAVAACTTDARIVFLEGILVELVVEDSIPSKSFLGGLVGRHRD